MPLYNLFAMNRDRYESLSPMHKQIIDRNSGMELSAKFGKIMSDADAAGRNALSPASINIVPAPVVRQWQRLTRPVIDQWVEEMNERGADGDKLLENARSLTEKYSQ